MCVCIGCAFVPPALVYCHNSTDAAAALIQCLTWLRLLHAQTRHHTSITSRTASSVASTKSVKMHDCRILFNKIWFPCACQAVAKGIHITVGCNRAPVAILERRSAGALSSANATKPILWAIMCAGMDIANKLHSTRPKEGERWHEIGQRRTQRKCIECST